MVRVDVLIPHYNAPHGLAVSLSSIQAQDFSGAFRIVVLDDGSGADACAEAERAVRSAEGPGREVVFLRNQANRGRPFSRNRLLDQIESPYVTWLDAGDVWYPQKTSRQYVHLEGVESRGVDVSSLWITCDYDWQWVGKTAEQVVQNVEGDQLQCLLRGDTLRAYLWTLLCPASSLLAVGHFDEKLPRLQDLDYFLRFVEQGGTLAKVPSLSPLPLCRYEKSDVGRNAWEVRRCHEHVLDKHRSAYLRYGARFLREARVKADLQAQRFARNNGDAVSVGYFKVRAALRDPSAALRRALANR